MKVSIYGLLVSCLLISQAAFAQPEKGCAMIGGTVGFNTTSYGEYSASSFQFAPSAGYFFTDRFAAGARLDIIARGGDASGSRIGIGPYGRFYFNGSGPARFFGQAGIAFYNIDPGGTIDSYTNFGFSLGAGVDYFLNESIALEAMLNFNSNKDSDDDESETNFGLNIGVSAFLCRGSK